MTWQLIGNIAGKSADESVIAELGSEIDDLKSQVETLKSRPDDASRMDSIAKMVSAAVEALPVPKDGVGLASAIIDRDGNLVVTLSDGTAKALGSVVGRDVDMDEVNATLQKAIADLPRPKDGADGLGFDDMEAVYDEHGRMLLKFTRGERVKEWRVPGMVDRGVYRPGETYLKGDASTWGSSLWIAQRDTTDKPGDGPEPRAWRLAVKRGGEGKTGAPGPQGIQGLRGEMGPQGRSGY